MSLNITARFARGAELTEAYDFSIAVERTAMENHSVPARGAGTDKAALYEFQLDLKYSGNAPMVTGLCLAGVFSLPLKESTARHCFKEW